MIGPSWLRSWIDDEKCFYDAIRVSFGPACEGYDPRRPFTDEELAQVVAHLNAFPSFSTLSLSRSDVTDDGLRHLHRLRNLEYLRLRATSISDQGLQHLATLPNLKKVELHRTNVTDAGIAELERSLPHCEIAR